MSAAWTGVSALAMSSGPINAIAGARILIAIPPRFDFLKRRQLGTIMRPVPDRDKRPTRRPPLPFGRAAFLGLRPLGAQKQALKRAAQPRISGQRHAGNEGAGIRQVQVGK